jgi:hypothetical protein
MLVAPALDHSAGPVAALAGRGAEILHQDDLFEANVSGYTRPVAFEADDVGRAGVTCEPAEDAAEGAGANVTVPLEQAYVVVGMKLGEALWGCVCHVPLERRHSGSDTANVASIEGFAGR